AEIRTRRPLRLRNGDGRALRRARVEGNHRKADRRQPGCTDRHPARLQRAARRRARRRDALRTKLQRRSRFIASLAAYCLAVGGVALASSANAQPIGRAETLALSHSIGRVEARLDDGRMGVGSAITVAKEILVTNCHVTSKAVSIKVVGGGMAWT